jgi:hypothetical protein
MNHSTETTSTKSTTGVFPFTMPWMGDAWSRAMHDGFERTKGFWDEYAKLEAQGIAHARTLLSEQNKLGLEAMGYMATLGHEWRKLAFESTRRTLDLLSLRGTAAQPTT